jgi:hypothetical protein
MHNHDLELDKGLKNKKLGWLAPRVPIHKEYPVNKKECSQPRPQSAAALAIAKNTCIPLD